MDILILLIPLSLAIVGVIAWVMLWATRNGQFDDLEGPAHSVIMDDDTPQPPQPPHPASEDKAAPPP